MPIQRYIRNGRSLLADPGGDCVLYEDYEADVALLREEIKALRARLKRYEDHHNKRSSPRPEDLFSFSKLGEPDGEIHKDG